MGYGTFLSGQSSWEGFYVDLRVANDVFVLPIKTDQYFTSGIQLEVGRSTTGRTPLGVRQTANQKRYWRFTQDIFTPRDIESNILMTEDRPFASYLTISRGRTYGDLMFGFLLNTEWTVGILGKYSGGGAMQNALHQAVDFADPLPGWKYEVEPDVVLNYLFDLRRAVAGSPRLTLYSHLRLRAGTLYTDLTPGILLRWRMIRLNATRYLDIKLLADGSLVAYNATLTGGLLNRDERYRGVIQPESLVGTLGLDVEATYDGVGLTGGLRYLTPEFRGGLEHLWAWVGIRVGW